MTDKSADNINKNIDQEGVRKELDELVQSKLQQLDEKLDAQAFEEEFREKAQELEKEKEAHYQRKGKRRSEASTGITQKRRLPVSPFKKLVSFVVPQKTHWRGYFSTTLP